MFQFADVTGDGRSDAVFFNTDYGTVTVGVSNGSSFRAITAFDQPWWEHGPSTPNMLKLADVNGDGKADAIYFDTQRSRGVWVGISDGYSFRANGNRGQQWWEHGVSTPDMLQLVDVNRDGKADAVYFDTFRSRGIWVGINDGKSFRGAGTGQWWEHGFSTPDQIQFADVTGDGRPDAIYTDAYRSQGLWVGVNMGNSFRGQGTGQWWPGAGIASEQIKFADIDGDRRAEALFFDKWNTEGVKVGSPNLKLYAFSGRDLKIGGFQITTVGLDRANIPNGLATQLMSSLEKAISRWERIIVNGLSDWGNIDDLQVNVKATRVDGAGSVLAYAKPTQLRFDGMPLTAEITIDSDDANNPQLVDILTHELGHALGLGSLWKSRKLLVNESTNNPLYVGINAVRQARLLSTAFENGIPVENEGGQGSAGAHWRDSVFGNELMTSFLSAGQNPISSMTIGALADLGYAVKYDVADPYVLPIRFMPSVGAAKSTSSSTNKSTGSNLRMSETQSDSSLKQVDSLLVASEMTKRNHELASDIVFSELGTIDAEQSQRKPSTKLRITSALEPAMVSSALSKKSM